MRKIYSLVLMAAALLVGTNARANVHDEQDPSDEASVTINGITRYATTIYDAFDAVGYDGQQATITLLTDIELEQSIVLYVPAEQASNPGKNIELNMNTFDISTKYNYINQTNTETTTKGAHTPFIILKGKLNITGEGNITNTCEDMGNNTDLSKGWPYWVSAGITLCGSASDDAFDFAKLTIGEKVTVTSRSSAGVALYAFTGLKQDLPSGNTTGYFGITESNVTTKLGYNNYDPAPRAGWGINIEISGHIYGEMYGMYVTGIISPCPTQDPKTQAAAYTADTTSKAYPRIRINSSAIIESGCDKYNGKSKNGIYSSGWGIWKIRGTVKGTTGLYMKGGDVNLNDANVKSCYGGTHESPIVATGAGGTGAGSAIIINSSLGGYPGKMSVTIEGDTQVSGADGCAIEEKVTSGESGVNVITIESGTFENSGTSPAIIVDSHTTSDQNATITVGGGTWSDNSAIDEGLVGTGGFATTTTNEDGQQVIVISNTSETGGGAVSWSENADINAAAATAYVKLTGTNSQTLTGDRTIAYLTMAAGTSLTIPTNKTLTVGEVILNWTKDTDPSTEGDQSAYATITVNPGGKLIVTGDKGVYAPKAENLVLQANANNQALFVISKDVNSNKQPNATVQLYTYCYKESATKWKWQYFATPLVETSSVTHSYGSTSIHTGVKYFDDITETWISPDSWSRLKPFMACAITNDLTEDDTKATYTFPGQLVGNVTSYIKRKAAVWNYYGNSFMAPMSTKALLNVLNNSGMDKVIYIWDFSAQKYWFVNPTMFGGDWGDEGKHDIPAMSFFVLRNKTAEEGNLDIDYDNSIYNFALGVEPELSAPARINNSNSNRVRINVQSENGMSDVVYLLESDNYSAEYEDGADVEKLMNKGINLYVADEMNLSMLYTNDMLNTMLTLQTSEDMNYTMTFGKVNGEVYALRDNMTNTVVLMNEGATYNFTAQPNATLEGRFQIVSRQEMPTAVETVEETVNAPKAIYTIMGQYVGESTDWNNLPAGVYVVDGVKVIK